MNTFSSTSRTLAIVTSAVGAVALLSLIGSATITAAGAFTAEDGGSGTQTASTRGVTSLSVDSSASAFTMRFADVPEATLEVAGDSRYRWNLDRYDDELVVESSQRFWDFCILGCFAGNERVTLTLPEELDDGTIDASLDLAAGSLDAQGAFRDLYIGVSAGSMAFDGAADSVTTSVNAGRADLTVDGAREADFDLSAGRTTAALTGDAPREVEIDVSAGRLDLTLPDTTYDLRSTVSAGSLDNKLRVSPNANRNIFASVSAGGATLHRGER